MLGNIYILAVFIVIVGAVLKGLLGISIFGAGLAGIIAGVLYAKFQKGVIPLKKALVIAVPYTLLSLTSTLLFGEAPSQYSRGTNIGISVLFFIIGVLIIYVGLLLGSWLYVKTTGQTK
ncbi:MAG: hypothetical protein JWL75_115 [Parcubacteria group bacterium]|nr:hypothetical protein [Parcubacteria group bacterium]